jgi:rhodanese-related sulfurtransferase
MPIRQKNEVVRTPAADSETAREHFERRLQLETDCWDVHATQDLDPRGFVLFDVRSRELYDKGHLPRALHMPHWEIDEARLASYEASTLFVVYCAGPHCNGAQKGALRLARLGRPVKEMHGGIEGWKDEGFELEAS